VFIGCLLTAVAFYLGG